MLLKKKVDYILDADIRGFFDNLDKDWLIQFVEHRVADPRILDRVWGALLCPCAGQGSRDVGS